MAKILQATRHNLEMCKQSLKDSNVIAVPTETVYGLAGNALDQIAVRNIFEIKNRPLYNPLIIHTDCLQNALKYAVFNEVGKNLAKKFWPGPLTMVLPKNKIIPDSVTANLDSVAIRCPQNTTFLKLLKKLSFPLAAPSANPFGYVSPTTAEHVSQSLGHKLDLILDGGDCKIGIESTIIDLRDENDLKILRQGPITKKELEKCTNASFNVTHKGETTEVRAPGMLNSHYSPSTPLYITTQQELNKMIRKNTNPEIAYIFQISPKALKYKNLPNVFSLSSNGEEITIAHNFYRILRLVDNMGFKKIHIQEIDEIDGLKAALNDRLSKAAT